MAAKMTKEWISTIWNLCKQDMHAGRFTVCEGLASSEIFCNPVILGGFNMWNPDDEFNHIRYHISIERVLRPEDPRCIYRIQLLRELGIEAQRIFEDRHEILELAGCWLNDKNEWHEMLNEDPYDNNAAELLQKCSDEEVEEINRFLLMLKLAFK